MMKVESQVEHSLRHIPSGIWVLGFVSLLMDISSEMIHSLLPLFMVTILGASTMAVGLVEGSRRSPLALVVKVFSGTLSDYLGKRKGLALFGYASGRIHQASLCRSLWRRPRLDRSPAGQSRKRCAWRATRRHGRGHRPTAAPGRRFRLAAVSRYGRAFFGPLLAVGLMLLWANDFRAVFWVAVLPGLMAVALFLFGIHEPEHRQTSTGRNPFRWDNLTRLASAYWWVVGFGAIFALARFSEAFLVLRAQHGGIPVALVPLVMVAMNLIYALSAYPFGKLSDQMSHMKLLALGLLVLIAADLVLAMNDHWGAVLSGVGLWGLHMGMTQGLLATMVADTAPADLRGTAYGFFNLTSGLAMLIASVLAGFLWDQFGASFTFYAGAMFCGIAVMGLTLYQLKIDE